MAKFLIALIVLICPATASAQWYGYGYNWLPPGYQAGLGYGTFYYPEPEYRRPRLQMNEAERYRLKLEILEAKQAYFARSRQVGLDDRQQAIENIKRGRALDKEEQALGIGIHPMRKAMGEEWWKEHGQKVK
jgi:hypothetical protein